MSLLAFLVALAALGSMGLSQSMHYRWAFGTTLNARRASRLRWGGAGLVPISFVPAAIAWGWAFGIVGWGGLLSLAAALLLLLRTFLPPRARR